MSEYSEALRLRPDFDAAHIMVGLLLAKEKKFDQAVVHYQAALKSAIRNRPRRRAIGGWR